VQAPFRPSKGDGNSRASSQSQCVFYATLPADVALTLRFSDYFSSHQAHNRAASASNNVYASNVSCLLDRSSLAIVADAYFSQFPDSTPLATSSYSGLLTTPRVIPARLLFGKRYRYSLPMTPSRSRYNRSSNISPGPWMVFSHAPSAGTRSLWEALVRSGHDKFAGRRSANHFLATANSKPTNPYRVANLGLRSLRFSTHDGQPPANATIRAWLGTTFPASTLTSIRRLEDEAFSSTVSAIQYPFFAKCPTRPAVACASTCWD